ncbi:MAG: hypothetical protein ACOC2N_06065 [Spirochaetota bacterium]
MPASSTRGATSGDDEIVVGNDRQERNLDLYAIDAGLVVARVDEAEFGIDRDRRSSVDCRVHDRLRHDRPHAELAAEERSGRLSLTGARVHPDRMRVL